MPQRVEPTHWLSATVGTGVDLGWRWPKTCAAIAHNLNLKEFLILGKSYKFLKRSDEKILSDGLEAVIGAVFLDQGLSVSEQLIYKLWSEYLDKSIITEIDSKTQLQEFSLKKYKSLPIYKSYNQTGPQHNPIFKVEVYIKNSKKFTFIMLI